MYVHRLARGSERTEKICPLSDFLQELWEQWSRRRGKMKNSGTVEKRIFLMKYAADQSSAIFTMTAYGLNCRKTNGLWFHSSIFPVGSLHPFYFLRSFAGHQSATGPLSDITVRVCVLYGPVLYKNRKEWMIILTGRMTWHNERDSHCYYTPCLDILQDSTRTAAHNGVSACKVTWKSYIHTLYIDVHFSENRHFC